MLALVRRARRRLFCNELFAQGANTASAALAAFILLLVVGAEVLTWQWLLLLPALAAGAGLYLAWRRLPSPYRAAQIVDRRMDLADTLSTALFFSQSARPARVSEEVLRLQSAAAERLAPSVDVRRAVPYAVPRTAYALAALLLVAGSLFALRYAVSRRLDLKPPLASLLRLNFDAESTHLARHEPPHQYPMEAETQDPDLALADTEDRKAGDPQDAESDRGAEASDEKLAQAETKNADNGAKAPDPEGAEAGDPEDGEAEDAAGNNDSGSGQQGDGGEPKPGNSQQDANNSSDSSSLMSKFKDAVENLLSRMKPQQSQSGGQPQSGEQQGQQGKGQQGGGQQSAKNGQQQSGQQGDAQDGQAGQQAQNSQDPQSKGAGNSDAKVASKQPGSGIGSQDGDKSIKQAEQLRAMGKISEIIGKRAQNISGETTVEVQATSQVLRTPYAQRAAQHSESGAEINRDEIPAALEAYVEQYFEQVRKQAPPKK